MTPRPDGEPPSGVAVIDKPAGWTSHQVVARVRRLAGTRKVGHAGTLDPMATGVLVVGLNRATRLLGYLTRTAKTYGATVRLGATTVTDDADGELVAVAGCTGLGEADVRAALPAFTGDLQQVPSSVSAIKVGGVRSYARVRAGAEVSLPPRPVRVDRFELLRVTPAILAGRPVLDCDVEVDCSSGTYVRALARDLGAALGVGGHLTALRRTRVGPFTLAEAQDLEAAAPSAGLSVLGLGEVARRCFPTLRIDEEQAARVRNGRRLEVELGASPTALLSEADELLALYRTDGAGAVAEIVLGAAS